MQLQQQTQSATFYDPAVDDAACRYFCMFRSFGRCDWGKVISQLEADGMTAPDGKPLDATRVSLRCCFECAMLFVVVVDTYMSW